MSRSLTIACAQTIPVIGDVSANLTTIEEYCHEAAQKGADIAVFSELALTGYHQGLLGDDLVNLAFRMEDEPIRKLQDIARKFSLMLVVGYIERRAIPGAIYNSIVIIDSDGHILDSYAKSHLFSSENLHFREGPMIRPVKTRFGNLGPMICMDIGYPEVGRLLCLKGAELLIAPSAWIEEDGDLWELLLRSRALDNLAFVVGVNHAGVEGELRYIGQSMVVDPRGHVINALGAEAGLLVTKIDLDDVVSARRKAPRFMLRRPELYGPIADLYQENNEHRC